MVETCPHCGRQSAEPTWVVPDTDVAARIAGLREAAEIAEKLDEVNDRYGYVARAIRARADELEREE